MMDATESVSGCCPRNSDVLLGRRKIAPPHQCLEGDRCNPLVCMVAGSSCPEAVGINASSEASLIRGFLNSPIEGRSRPRKGSIPIRKSLDTQLNSQ